jgi:hypothetical protein
MLISALIVASKGILVILFCKNNKKTSIIFFQGELCFVDRSKIIILQCQCCSNFTTPFSFFSSEDALNGTKG